MPVLTAEETVTMRRTVLIVLFLLLVGATAMVSPASAQPTGENPGDVAADFNNDGVADLAVGVPGENDIAGAVNVLYGSSGGLTTTGGQLFTQVGGAVEAGDAFGAQLASGDFNDNGFADLAAAAPTEDVGTAAQAGGVSVLQGEDGGLTTTGGGLFTQNSPGVPGTAETFDLFGGLEIVF
jgi:FG-GAP repeat